jgi:hypothetical protein
MTSDAGADCPGGHGLGAGSTAGLRRGDAKVRRAIGQMIVAQIVAGAAMKPRRTTTGLFSPAQDMAAILPGRARAGSVADASARATGRHTDTRPDACRRARVCILGKRHGRYSALTNGPIAWRRHCRMPLRATLDFWSSPARPSNQSGGWAQDGYARFAPYRCLYSMRSTDARTFALASAARLMPYQ